ncbi:MAG: sodium:solute symporter [Acidobacteria bacterium]|nr:sodium:solute symporter [Acidobacteriota bacterium]
MSAGIDWVASAVFGMLLALVAAIGFVASRWKRADLHAIEEWGLAGRRFGTLITWFLLGGDLFTAYTVIAVPGLIYGTGGPGFFALSYAALTFSFAFVSMPRLWSVCKRHGYVTAGDFVRGRYGSHWLALAVTLTGILATIPYLALQLVGVQVSVAALGIGHTSASIIPLLIAFGILAGYTWKGGLRAPASIALVKDVMIYAVVLTCIIYLPLRLGGYSAIFRSASIALAARPHPASLLLAPNQYLSYGTLVFGSALALFLYPHSITAILSSSSGAVIRRNCVYMPAYTFLLGLIALLGYCALAAGVKVASSSDVVPALFVKVFPSWFAGFCLASLAIGALVPAAIMSIAAANLFTRNIFREYIDRNLQPRSETLIARAMSLAIALAALCFVLLAPPQYAINLQLLGGIWILQTLPAVVLGLFTRWFHSVALLAGWFAGMVVGTSMAVSQHLTAVYPFHFGTHTISAYAGVFALLLNMMIALGGSAFANAFPRPRQDETSVEDYISA